MAEFFRAEAGHNGYVAVDYSADNDKEYPGLFGVFLETGYSDDQESWNLIELPRKEARKMAKAILKVTKRKGHK